MKWWNRKKEKRKHAGFMSYHCRESFSSEREGQTAAVIPGRPPDLWGQCALNFFVKTLTKQIDAFAITKYMNAMNWLLLAG